MHSKSPRARKPSIPVLMMMMLSIIALSLSPPPSFSISSLFSTLFRCCSCTVRFSTSKFPCYTWGKMQIQITNTWKRFPYTANSSNGAHKRWQWLAYIKNRIRICLLPNVYSNRLAYIKRAVFITATTFEHRNSTDTLPSKSN